MSTTVGRSPSTGLVWIAVVGARSDDDSAENAGAAYVFARDAVGWAEQAKLYTSDDRQVMESGVAKIALSQAMAK